MTEKYQKVIGKTPVELERLIKIRDGKIKNFFEPAVKEWYEETFLIVMSQEVVDNPKSFIELKKFYNNIDKKKYQDKSKN